MGTIKDIVWDVGADPQQHMPKAILATFDGYQGPTYTHPDTLEQVLPISPVDGRWEDGVEEHSRRQFPINLAFAITVHKSQGMTLRQAVLDIIERDFTAGLSYVAFSRVKTLRGVLFTKAFDFERFTSQDGNTLRFREEDALRRSKEQDVAAISKELRPLPLNEFMDNERNE